MTLRKLWAVVAVNFLVAAVGLHVVTTYLYSVGRIPEYCRGTVLRCLADLFRRHWADDSWGPMLAALHVFESNSHVSIYQQTFFAVPIVKFQYPLPTLLPLWVLHRLSFGDATIDLWLHVFSWLTVVGNAVCAAAIALRSAPLGQSRAGLAGLALFTSFTFYPFLWAYQIGQIQIFGDLIFSMAFYCWLTRRERSAGIAVGLLAVMKPQFVLMLLWGLLRRRWQFASMGLITVVVAFLVSMTVFGLANHLDYFAVINWMSRHGESYFPNQSFNGLLNRLLLNWSSIELYTDRFPPYRPAIYILTTLTSVALIVWALTATAARKRIASTAETSVAHASVVESTVLDFSLIAIVSTAASPIAWYHHYGILLPVFVWLFAELAEQQKPGGRATWPIIIAYVLVANDPRITNLAAGKPIVNLVQSVFFCGVLVLMITLWMRMRGQRSQSKEIGASC